MGDGHAPPLPPVLDLPPYVLCHDKQLVTTTTTTATNTNDTYPWKRQRADEGVFWISRATAKQSMDPDVLT